MKKFKKKLICILAIFFILFTGYGLIVFLLIWNSRKDSPAEKNDAMLILGAQVKGTKESPCPSQSLKERLDKGLEYWQAHQEMTIIVSGGQGDDEPVAEGEVMGDYLIQNGVPSTQIIREKQAASTKENIAFSRRLFPFDKILIVTSDFHICRAKLLAKRMGIRAQGLGSPTRNASKYYSWLRETLALGYTILFR